TSGKSSARLLPEVQEKSGGNIVNFQTKSTSGGAQEQRDHIPEAQKPDSIVADTIDYHGLYERLATAAGNALNPTCAGLQMIAEPIGWLQSGADLDLDVLPTVSRLASIKQPGSVNSWMFFRGAVAEARD